MTRETTTTELGALCERYGIAARHATTPTLATDADGWEHWASDVTVTYEGRELTIPYRRGTGHDRDALDVADVVASVVADAYYGGMSYDEFLDELGYGDDVPRRSYATWQACQDIGPRVVDLFGADLAETLRAAEH